MIAFCPICLRFAHPGHHIRGLALRATVRAADASRPLVQALKQKKSRAAWMQRFALLHALSHQPRQPALDST